MSRGGGGSALWGRLEAGQAIIGPVQTGSASESASAVLEAGAGRNANSVTSENFTITRWRFPFSPSRLSLALSHRLEQPLLGIGWGFVWFIPVASLNGRAGALLELRLRMQALHSTTNTTDEVVWMGGKRCWLWLQLLYTFISQPSKACVINHSSKGWYGMWYFYFTLSIYLLFEWVSIGRASRSTCRCQFVGWYRNPVSRYTTELKNKLDSGKGYRQTRLPRPDNA